MSTINDAESVTEPLAVSIERGAARLGVTSRHLRKYLDTDGGPIRTVRMGDRVLIPVDELRNYVKPPDKPAADTSKPPPAKTQKSARVRRRVGAR